MVANRGGVVGRAESFRVVGVGVDDGELFVFFVKPLAIIPRVRWESSRQAARLDGAGSGLEAAAAGSLSSHVVGSGSLVVVWWLDGSSKGL